MASFPTNFEIFEDNETDLIATFSAVDSESLEVTIDKKILDGDELRELAVCLDKAKHLLKTGVNNENKNSN
ncbi:hypothetical protein [Arcobacter arenosus]|uniref:Uncharacterized protein n=1 Tax=Arcobacter arenosus TaxID=2576037 RepID=A0A5R8Y4M6_9BACT|nr:hypothetical protein [Arcobacter arenosus]TLP41074.1 hypothetical protein FDK22_03370 [Arcobacter arenosus]